MKKRLHGVVEVMLFTKGKRKAPLNVPRKTPPGLLPQYTKKLITETHQREKCGDTSSRTCRQRGGEKTVYVLYTTTASSSENVQKWKKKDHADTNFVFCPPTIYRRLMPFRCTNQIYFHKVKAVVSMIFCQPFPHFLSQYLLVFLLLHFPTCVNFKY